MKLAHSALAVAVGLCVFTGSATAANSPVTAIGGTTDNLTSISAGGFDHEQAQFIGGNITAFTSAPGGNNSNILLEDGGTVPASGSRQELLGGDFNLNTGIINQGNGNDTVTYEFDEPVVNLDGPDIFIVEIASNFDPDSMGLMINGQTGSIDGGASGNAADLGEWGDTGLVSNSDLFARAGGAPNSLSDLENGTYNLSNANIAQRLYGIGIDLSDFGVALGASVTSMQYGSAAGGEGTADPTLIIGVKSAALPGDPEIAPVAPADFGTVAVNDQPASIMVEVENLGPTQDLVISNDSITGTDAGLFSIVSAPGTIGPGPPALAWVQR